MPNFLFYAAILATISSQVNAQDDSAPSLDSPNKNQASILEFPELQESISLDVSSPDKSLLAKQNQVKAAARASQKVLAFENDYSYLRDPEFDSWLLGDSLKQNTWLGSFTLDVGGQYRTRFHAENGMRGSTGQNNDFVLHRTRLYTNLKLSDSLRVFVEGIDAFSAGETIAPRGIDENHYDILNAFIDTKLLDSGDCQLVFRAGRQEFSFGDERFVSNLDWANTRRTFHGYQMKWKSSQIEASLFYANPLQTNRRRLDSINDGQELFGIYSTLKTLPVPVDLYYLVFNQFGNFSYDTIGTRFKGAIQSLQYEFEGAVQWGKDGSLNHQGESFTSGLGKNFEGAPFTPSVWLYYDWASGARDGSLGYHHGLPLAHKYLGFMDFFGRRNVSDVNLLATAKPIERLKLIAWFHHLARVNSMDTLYDVGMNGFGNVGGSDKIGQELDILSVLQVTPRSKLIFGYSKFFAGNYFATNGNLSAARDADFVYTQFEVNF